MLRAVQATVAGENGNWSQVVGTAIERIKERKETSDGRIASNSENFINDLARFFNTEIKHTRNLLSAAKRTEYFMSVFDRLHYLAQAYYDQDEGLDANNKAVACESQQRIDFDWGQSL